jgi:hypothetical protein
MNELMEQLIWATPDNTDEDEDEDDAPARIPTHDGPVKRDKAERKRQKAARRKSRK